MSKSRQAAWLKQSLDSRLRQAYNDFTTVFPPNPYKYGVLRDYGEGGKKNVHTVDFRERGEEPGTAWPALLANHFRTADEGRIGYLPGTRGGTTAGCIDIDKHVFLDSLQAVLQAVLDAASSAKLEPLLELSTSGGWHVWFWAKEPVPYETMRDVLQWITYTADVGVLETYPMGSRAARGRWVFMPYAGIGIGKEGLGRTFLQNGQGEAIPIWDLKEAVGAVASPAKLFKAIATRFEKTKKQQAPEASEEATLDDEALEQLRVAAANPPDAFDRHHSVFAFVNVAERAGRGREMVEYLQSKDVYQLWVAGRAGERSLDGWHEELERIWLAVQGASDLDQRRYGLAFLLANGWEVPDLARKVEAMPVSTGWTKAVDDDLPARWLASQLEMAGVPLAGDSGTPFLYQEGTWFPLATPEDAVNHAVKTVLRPA